jgi:hypothetical protein
MRLWTPHHASRAKARSISSIDLPLLSQETRMKASLFDRRFFGLSALHGRPAPPSGSDVSRHNRY